MRMGVLDIGSNTGHLLIVDAYRGGPPLPAYSFKEPLRLAEQLGDDNCVTDDGVARLVKYVGEAKAEALERGCSSIVAFATSAVRDADNADAVLAAVHAATGVDLRVLHEGLCIQTLHVGPYDDEGPVLARMHDVEIPSAGLRLTGRHHEVYLGDPRRTAPERLRTILRQPVAPVES